MRKISLGYCCHMSYPSFLLPKKVSHPSKLKYVTDTKSSLIKLTMLSDDASLSSLSAHEAVQLVTVIQFHGLSLLLQPLVSVQLAQVS